MRAHRLGVVSACSALVLLGTAAQGQRQLLDLSGGAPAPAAGSGAAALGLADELESQAKELERTGEASDGARGAVRRLATQFLVTGERAGLVGSTRVVMGRTLANGMPGVDEVLGRIEGAGATAKLEIIAADCSSAVRILASPASDPWRVARDALAVLEQEAEAPSGAYGWWDGNAGAGGQKLTEAGVEWSKSPGVRPDIAAALALLESTLAAGETWTAYRPSAARVRGLVIGAGGALGALPAWAPSPSRERLGEDFARAVEGILNRERERGEARLERITHLAALAAKTELLETGSAGQKVRTALAQLMGVPVADPSGERRALEAYERALDLALSKFALEDERTLARPLRPAWRALSGLFKQGEAGLYAALPELARRPEAMTEPGIVATLNDQQRLAEDLHGLVRLNELVAAPAEAGKEPELKPAWTKLANRALKLGQDLARPAGRERTLASLRALVSQVVLYESLPGEDKLEEAALDSLTGGRGKALRDSITKHRALWLARLEKGESAEDEAARLAAIRAALEVVEDLSVLEPAGLPALSAPYQRLQAHPAWELSGAALAGLASGLNDQVGEVCRAAMEDPPAKAGEALAKLRSERAVLILAGKLASEAANQPARGGGPLREVGSGGPPHGAWLAMQAVDLAAVCRYAEEAPAARRTARRADAEADLKFANQTASRLLDGMK